MSMIMIHVNVNNFENRNLSSGSRLLRQVQMCDSKKEHCVGHIVSFIAKCIAGRMQLFTNNVTRG